MDKQRELIQTKVDTFDLITSCVSHNTISKQYRNTNTNELTTHLYSLVSPEEWELGIDDSSFFNYQFTE